MQAVLQFFLANAKAFANLRTVLSVHTRIETERYEWVICTDSGKKMHMCG
jgi:hypothetical protein